MLWEAVAYSALVLSGVAIAALVAACVALDRAYRIRDAYLARVGDES